MVYKKRIIAPIAFIWTLAAAGMVAVALAVSPATTLDIQLDDVQVGERDNQTRIALICDSPCVVEKRGAREFLLRGVTASLELDLSERAKNVSMLTAMPMQDGALLSISTVGVVEYANTKNCTVGGRQAACIDLFFAQMLQSAPDIEAAVTGVKTPSLKNAANQLPAAIHVSADAAPILREAEPDRMMRFAGLTPPERLSPASGAILAKVQPVERPAEIAKPNIRTETRLNPAQFNFNQRISQILKKELTQIHCATADLTLQADAWALDAMVDAGLCAAVRGDVEEADAMLARLLEYTPDNYEALVGRALIAEQADEKGVARKYFQDALNALPPIAESNRIVQAMSAL